MANYSSYKKKTDNDVTTDTSNSDKIYTKAKATTKNTYDSVKNSAKNIYETTLANAKSYMQQSKAEADVLNQKLAKYLPNYLKSQGVNGGLSESYALKANSNLNNLQASINQNYTETANNANTTYQNALAQAESTYQNSLANNEQNYFTNKTNEISQNDSLAYSNQQALETELQNIIASSSQYSSTEDYVKALSNAYDTYSNAGLGKYSNMEANYVNSLIQSAQEGENGLSTGINGEKYSVGSNGVITKTNKDGSIENYSTDNPYFAVDLKVNGKYDYDAIKKKIGSAAIGVSAKGSNSSDYVQAVLDALNAGKVKNGDIIKFNYGYDAGTNYGFMYLDGNLYRVNLGDYESVKIFNPDSSKYKQTKYKNIRKK